MIPLYDENDCRRFPLVNTLLIAINIIVFGFELAAGSGLEKIFMQYGTISNNVVHHFDLHQLSTLFSCCFLHAGFAHLLGNLWVLYLFGDNVEDRLGRFKYLLFYLFCGLMAGASQILSDPNCAVPAIGASGAIAGVLGAYLILFPDIRVKLFIYLFWQPMVPAWAIMGGWFALQCLSAATPSSGVESVAWFAHIGGFIAGLSIVALMREHGLVEIDESDVISVACSRNPNAQIKFIPRLSFGPIFAAIVVGVTVGMLMAPPESQITAKANTSSQIATATTPQNSIQKTTPPTHTTIQHHGHKHSHARHQKTAHSSEAQ